jgi:hypothetical protein
VIEEIAMLILLTFFLLVFLPMLIVIADDVWGRK